MKLLMVIKRHCKPGNHHARLHTLKLLSLWLLLHYAAETDTVLPLEKSDDITDACYVSFNDACVESPQIRDAALALMSLQSPQQGKQFVNTSYYNICIKNRCIRKKFIQ